MSSNMSSTDTPDNGNDRARAEERAIYDVPQDDQLARGLAAVHQRVAELDGWKAKRPDLWPIVLKKMKIRWTTDSNAIEGSTLTFADTLFFLEQGLTVQGKPLKDFLDARNHSDAIELVFDAVANRRPISESFVKELNALLLSGVRSTPARDQFGNIFEKPANPGQYKQQPNHVILPDGDLHTYADPLHVQPQMQALVDYVDQSQHDPVVVAALAHYNFVRIHPFDDGNGRGARILMNLVIMRGKLPPAVIRNEDRAEYLATLRQADAGAGLPFVMFVARSVHDTLKSMIDDFEKATPRNGQPK